MTEGWWLACTSLQKHLVCYSFLPEHYGGLHYRFCSQFYEQEEKYADNTLLATNAWKKYKEDLQETDA